MRCAASAASPGSTSLRASKSSSSPLSLSASTSPTGRISASGCSVVRYVPSPWRISATPSIASARSASRREERLTPIVAASSRSGGSRSPALSWRSVISAISREAI